MESPARGDHPRHRRAMSCRGDLRVRLLLFASLFVVLAWAAPATAAADYRDTVAGTPDLVSHWRFGELTGTAATDQQGTNGGVYLGSPALGAEAAISADPDKAVRFDGIDDSVKMTSSLSLGVVGALTWEGWIKPTSVGCARYLFDKVHYAASFGCNGDLRFMLYPSGVFTDLYSPVNSFVAGERYHVALTWDGATMRIYRNGVELASKSAAGTLQSSYDLIIGADSNGYDPVGRYFDGVMDEVALYGRALDVVELRQHYAAGVGDTTPPETTISAGPSGTTQAIAATFEFGSSEPGSSFECRLDGGAWSSCSSPQSYSSLADGPHTFEARATDKAFNTDPTPASRSWTVESSPYAALVRETSGLAAYWRFGDTTGTKATSETETNHGTYLASPALGANGLLVADPDPAVGLDGTDDNVKVLDSASLESSNGLTWETWIKPSSVACSRRLLDKVAYAAGFGCSGNLRFMLRPNGVFTDLYSPANAFVAGERYHVALTWDGATMRIYKNGAEVASKLAAGTLPDYSYNLIIGADSTGYDARGSYFSGSMDETAFYNRALTANEVRRHYDVGVDPTSP